MKAGSTAMTQRPRDRVPRGSMLAPGFLAGPSGIHAGWVLETKSRLGAE